MCHIFSTEISFENFLMINVQALFNGRLFFIHKYLGPVLKAFRVACFSLLMFCEVLWSLGNLGAHISIFKSPECDFDLFSIFSHSIIPTQTIILYVV